VIRVIRVPWKRDSRDPRPVELIRMIRVPWKSDPRNPRPVKS
jgi:hypothetical protein